MQSIVSAGWLPAGVCVCAHGENVCLCGIASPYPFGIIEFGHQKGVKGKIARGGATKSELGIKLGISA